APSFRSSRIQLPVGMLPPSGTWIRIWITLSWLRGSSSVEVIVRSIPLTVVVKALSGATRAVLGAAATRSTAWLATATPAISSAGVGARGGTDTFVTERRVPRGYQISTTSLFVGR